MFVYIACSECNYVNYLLIDNNWDYGEEEDTSFYFSQCLIYRIVIVGCSIFANLSFEFEHETKIFGNENVTEFCIGKDELYMPWLSRFVAT